MSGSIEGLLAPDRAQRINGPSIKAAGAGRFSLCAWLTSSVLICPFAAASESAPAGAYHVTTEIGMPHLQENLRYSTVRENRCWNNQSLASAFPILKHESLYGCTLSDESRHEDTVSYVLLCEGGHGTTGTARWRLSADQIRGTLDVRLGGKNMTFYQHVTARRVGDCISEAK